MSCLQGLVKVAIQPTNQPNKQTNETQTKSMLHLLEPDNSQCRTGRERKRQWSSPAWSAEDLKPTTAPPKPSAYTSPKSPGAPADREEGGIWRASQSRDRWFSNLILCRPHHRESGRRARRESNSGQQTKECCFPKGKTRRVFETGELPVRWSVP